MLADPTPPPSRSDVITDELRILWATPVRTEARYRRQLPVDSPRASYR